VNPTPAKSAHVIGSGPAAALGHRAPAGISALAAADRPLSVTHLNELAAARDRAKSIRKAARVAAFNGWTTATFAACSALFALFDPSGWLITAGLALVAYNEFRGRKRLLAFDPSAASLLGWNQLGLLAMITVYCLWSMFTSSSSTATLSAEFKDLKDLDSILSDYGGTQGLVRSLSYGVYGSVIVLSALFQGGNALYYFTRRRLVDDFVAQTPDWVREVQGSAI
jgi:hypothetical protein